ncbi:MAG: hypothetical protein Q9186_002201 [Xanthomendoza sp. 1 TL-2023]
MSIAGRFARLVRSPLKFHIYVSRSHDVAVNLSIEHYLFQNSHPTSSVLFLYVNRPCIVIGRNQNPWLEVNYPLVRQSTALLGTSTYPHPNRVQVIRRRSGGGTVFHDLGNVNFSIIFSQPKPGYNQYKHAEMVVRAIRKTNPRARVNKRHDIVLDPGPLLEKMDRPDPKDTYRTAFQFNDECFLPRKVSGSAGKASGKRALHHGTCLLASPNLSSISEYLRSPAAPFLKGKGSESVRSPVDNIISQASTTTRLATVALQHHIVEAFAQMYGLDMTSIVLPKDMDSGNTDLKEDHGCASGIVDATLLEIPEIRSGHSEIQTPEYLYEQTPRFMLSSHTWKDDERMRPPLPAWFPPHARVFLESKSGVVISSRISVSEHPDIAASESKLFDSVLKDCRIARIRSFWDILGGIDSLSRQMHNVRRIAAWLDQMLGKESDFRLP